MSWCGGREQVSEQERSTKQGRKGDGFFSVALPPSQVRYTIQCSLLEVEMHCGMSELNSPTPEAYSLRVAYNPRIPMLFIGTVCSEHHCKPMHAYVFSCP